MAPYLEISAVENGNGSFGQPGRLTGVFAALRVQPVAALFRGMTATLLRDVPFSATYWYGYETAKLRLRVPEEVVKDAFARTFLQSLACGAGAGMAATIVIAPLDVVKTVRQHQIESGAATSYAAILRTMRLSPAVAFTGTGLRLVRVPLGLATMMAALEVTKLAFERRRSARSSTTN